MYAGISCRLICVEKSISVEIIISFAMMLIEVIFPVFIIFKNHYMIFRHGTRCAGVIAGKRNGTCRNGGGIAYNTQLAGKQKTKNTYRQLGFATSHP